METRESHRTSVLPERPGREADPSRPGLGDARQAWADVVRAAWLAAGVSVSMARQLGRVDVAAPEPATRATQQHPHHWRLRPRLTVRSAEARGEVRLPHRVHGPLS